MRYSPTDKTEIIRLVEQSHLAARRTLEKLGIPRSSFYRWCDRYQRGGPEGLADRPSRPDRGLEPHPRGYRQPDCRPGAGSTRTQPAETGGALHGRGKILCLRGLGLSAAESARSYHQPSLIVIKAAEEFKDKTTAPNQLWQTDFTYLKITGWGWCYLSTVLDDFSRFIVAWKLCATMKAQDVTATLDWALAASGLDQMNVVHRPYPA
jgi:putative transposase